MTIEITKLKNDLRIATDYMKDVESVSISIWVKTGSRNENIKNNGISHFFSVAKAHFSFYYKIFDLIKKRRNIKQMKNLTAKMPWSILLKNKIQGIKIFSRLN